MAGGALVEHDYEFAKGDSQVVPARAQPLADGARRLPARRCSRPLLPALLAAELALFARRRARRLAAARSCARRSRCCAGCRRAAAPRGGPGGRHVGAARVRRGADRRARLPVPRPGGADPPARRGAGRVLARGAARAAVRVGLDLLFLVPGQTGGRETYARELRRAASRPTLEIDRARQPRDARRRRASGARRRTVVPVGSSGVARGSWALGELWRLPRAARGLDVLHSPGELRPGRAAALAARADRARRALAQAPGHRPDARCGCGTDVLVAGAARRAGRVITVSQASRADLAAELGLPRSGSTSSPTASRRRPPTPPPPADARPGRPPAACSASPPTCRTRTSPRWSTALARAATSARCSRSPATAPTPAACAPARRERGVRRRAAARRRRRGAARGALRRRDASSPRRRATRASASPCSRRWRAACRSRARTCRCCARWPATPRVYFDPATRRRSPRRSAPALADAERAAARRPRARRSASPGPPPRAATAAVYERALATRQRRHGARRALPSAPRSPPRSARAARERVRSPRTARTAAPSAARARRGRGTSPARTRAAPRCRRAPSGRWRSHTTIVLRTP